MIDVSNINNRIEAVDQEDRALQRCNPSDWSMPEDGQEHIIENMLLSSCSSFLLIVTGRTYVRKVHTLPHGRAIASWRRKAAARKRRRGRKVREITSHHPQQTPKPKDSVECQLN